MTPTTRYTAVLTITAGVLAPELYGAGFRLPDQDAFASARGEAFVATADNPSAVYYNPAGLSQLKGWHTRVGSYNIYLAPKFESAAGGNFGNSHKWHAVPQVFTAYGPEKLPLTFGLGVYSPYGLGIKWPHDTGFRSLALESKLAYMTVNPVVSWQVLPTLSIGGGPTINYSRTDLRIGVLPVPLGDELRFKGDDYDVGFNLGARWQPHEKLALGISYRSKTTMDYKGHTSLNMGPFPGSYDRMEASSSFPIPQNFVVGLSYRPTKNWNLEFNADFTQWSRMRQVTIDQAVPLPAIPMNWESSWYYEFGVTRYLSKGWSVSAGYIFNESCMPDAFFNPLVADIDKHFGTVGVGWQGKRVGLDVAYQFGYGPERTVSGSAMSAAGQNADGRYEFISHAFSVSMSWRF